MKTHSGEVMELIKKRKQGEFLKRGLGKVGGYSLTKQCLEESQQTPQETWNNLQNRKEVEDDSQEAFQQYECHAGDVSPFRD